MAKSSSYRTVDPSTSRYDPTDWAPSAKLVAAIRDILLKHGADPEGLKDLRRDLHGAISLYMGQKHTSRPTRRQLRIELEELRSAAINLTDRLNGVSPFAAYFLSQASGRQGQYASKINQATRPQLLNLVSVIEEATSWPELTTTARWRDYATRVLAEALTNWLFRKHTGSWPKRRYRPATKDKKGEPYGPLHDMMRIVLEEIDPGRLMNRETGVDGIIQDVLKSMKK